MLLFQYISRNSVSDFQLSQVECMIHGAEEADKKTRSILRKCLYALSPKSTIGDQQTINKTARAVFRLVAPDEVFQYFTREATTKSTKRPLSSTHPKLNQLLTTVIMTSTGCGLDKSRTGISYHLARCSDRKKSKRVFDLNTSASTIASQTDIDDSSD